MTGPVVIGRATLYNADCRDILPKLGKADAVVTDPPYGTQVTEWDNPISDETVAQIIAATDGYAAFFYSNTRLASLLNAVRAADRDAWVAVWHKSNAMGFERRFAPQWVPIVVAYRGNPPFWGQDYFMCPVTRQAVNHPTPKPLGITRWIIERSSENGQTVLDPFLGSGTTGIAAVQSGRDFIGIERDPKYFDEACKRIEQAQRQGDFFVEAA